MTTLSHRNTSGQAKKVGLSQKFNAALSGDFGHLFRDRRDTPRIEAEIGDIRRDIADKERKLRALEEKLRITRELEEKERQELAESVAEQTRRHVSSKPVDKIETNDYPIKPFNNKLNRNFKNLSSLLNGEEKRQIAPQEASQPIRTQNDSSAARILAPSEAPTLRAKVHSTEIFLKALSWGVYEGLIIKAIKKLGAFRVGEMLGRIAKLANSYFRYTNTTTDKQRGVLFRHELVKLGVIPPRTAPVGG